LEFLGGTLNKLVFGTFPIDVYRGPTAYNTSFQQLYIDECAMDAAGTAERYMKYHANIFYGRRCKLVVDIA